MSATSVPARSLPAPNTPAWHSLRSNQRVVAGALHGAADLREWGLEQNPTGCVSSLGQRATLSESLGEILLIAGILRSPPKPALTSTVYWASLRYGQDFIADRRELARADGVRQLDLDLTIACATDLGVGICGLVMHRYMDIVWIADVSDALGHVVQRHKPTSYKRTDYVGATVAGRYVITEAKGGGGAYITGAGEEKAKEQLANTRLMHGFQSLSPGKLAVLTELIYEDELPDDQSMTRIVDPPSQPPGESSADAADDYLVRASYAKTFNLLGIPNAAIALMNDEELNPADLPGWDSTETGGRDWVLLAESQKAELHMYRGVVDVLFGDTRGELGRRLQAPLRAFRDAAETMPQTIHFTLPSGFAVWKRG